MKNCYLFIFLLLALFITRANAQTTITGATGNHPTAATLDADANIYAVQFDGTGLEFDAGDGHYDVVKYTASSGYTSSTVIYHGLYYDGLYPTDIEVAANGDVFVLDGVDEPASTGAILRLDASNSYSSSTIPLLGTYPSALGIDANDNIYVAEWDGGSDYHIVKYTAASGYTSSSVIYNGGLGGIDGYYPRGLTVDPDGNVYVSTDFNQTISASNIIKLTGSGFSYTSSTIATKNFITGLASNALGDIYAVYDDNKDDSYELYKIGDSNPIVSGILRVTNGEQTRYPYGLGSNLALGDLVIPDPFNSSGGRLLYLKNQPTVTTSAATSINATSATLGGNVTDDGVAPVNESGIVWNTTGTPDIDNDNVVSMGSGTGSFSQSVGLLPFGTQIFVRAYATNSEGTSYGTEESFTTGSTVTVDLTGSEGWRLLSVPAAVNLSTFLGPIWTQGVTTGGDTDFGTPNVYTWDLSSTDNDHTQWWNEVTDLTGTTLPAGQGLLVYVYEDPDYTGPTTPGLASQVLTVNSSEHSAPVSSPPLNANLSGWSLLGNPFGVPVQWDELALSDVEDAIYVWDPNVDSWDGGQGNQDSGSWITRAGGTGQFDGVIHPFQGFFVQNSASGTPGISMEQLDKVTDAATFYGKQPADQLTVALELSGQGLVNTTWLRFSPDGSTEPAEGEAWELQPLSQHYALLATQKTDGSLVDIGHYPQSAELKIPLVTEATQTGSYAITVTDFEAPGQSLYLNDLQTGESIRLEENTRYEFMMEQAAKAPADPFAILQGGLKKQATDGHRFVISSSALENPVETPEQFTLEQNYPNPFNPSTVISYQLPVNSDVRLEVFDLSGRQIATLINTRQTAGNYSVNFDGSDLSSGVYMYRLQANGISFTKKLTLIK